MSHAEALTRALPCPAGAPQRLCGVPRVRQPMLSHIDRKLMREIRSKPGMPVWREDEDGQSMSSCHHACRPRCDRHQ